MNDKDLERLGKRIAKDALVRLIDLVPGIRYMPSARLEAACAAMRANSRAVVAKMLDDATAAPERVMTVFDEAIMTLAKTGVKAL